MLNPPRPKRTVFRKLIPAVIIAAVILILSGVRGQYLLLVNENTGKILLLNAADDDTRFSVSYTHSVNKSTVSEHYEVRAGKIFLTELHYKAFGAGMPTEPEDGQLLRYENGDMIISGFDREMTRLCYSIGRVANHTLTIGSKELPLNTLDEPGQPVIFSLAVYPRFFAFLHHSLFHRMVFHFT